MTYSERLTRGLPGVRDTIGAAAATSGRDPDAVTLVAVTKAHPLEAAQAALDAGLQHLGENRVEELQWKAEALAGTAVRWHMVGHVQRRKVPRLAGIPQLVHSIDSVRLAQRFSSVAVESGQPFRVLLQANTSGEGTKGGFSRDELVEAIHEIVELPSLEIRGLMTMAPLTDDEDVLRATFRRLREVHETLRSTSAYEADQLSMGMTNDYQIAIEEGSTMVRIGTALFGARQR
ncbi:MAG: YggS family pyridoxal phosphate-dependent enzyme [Gemmatimonadota bacterium]|nr:MAG: YggS family pyridoxal phosphate-dependent enzyme [Gemmatimonadota bacterium]